MLTIGDFARLVGVSVRMLRHYDRLGLLLPARVDQFTGYRFYRAEQLGRANRLIALKDLGFTLDQVGRVLDGRLDDRALRDLLTTRRDELAAQITGDQDRLRQVEARLRSIIEENTMSQNDFRITSLPELRLGQVSTTVPDGQSVGEAVGPLFGRVADLVEQAGVQRRGPDIGHYSDGEGGLNAAAAAQLDPEHVPEGLTAATLPAIDKALVMTYTSSSVDDIPGAWQQLTREAESRGLTLSGPCREIYLETPFEGGSGWVIELQQPVS